MSGFKVPIALLNFNRPKMTRQVFEIVRQVKPKQLLLIADGPREDRPDDVRLCLEVRAVFEEIDWECEVFRNYSDVNLGSFKSNSTGLNWVFDMVEEAIILEDDFLPSISFFRYSEELLERYRYDQRIGIISANNFVAPPIWQKDASYYFSAYALTWGWASWRRVWKQVDLSMSWWESESGKDMLSTLHPRPAEWKYWHRLYERISSGEMKNAWDYQLILSCFRHSQLCVVPKVNLVTNIGYGAEATHTTHESAMLGNRPRSDLDFPLHHPESIRRSGHIDHEIFLIRIIDRGSQPSIFRKSVSRLLSVLPATWKAKLKKWVQGMKRNLSNADKTL